MARRLVLGTYNVKKGRELQELLAPHDFQLRTLADVADPCQVEETGQSFAENAALKARDQARHLKQWVLGEDSGLCVDVLGGAPGIYSARYSGPAATDESNNQRLLEALADVPLEQRKAHYVCHVAVADPAGNLRATSEAYCHGRIARRPSGTAGFGYDPLFEVLEYHRTFGQLGDVVKSLISHRARAMRALLARLIELADRGW
jgi:XTP/dITP diphosphohydrolase